MKTWAAPYRVRVQVVGRSVLLSRSTREYVTFRCSFPPYPRYLSSPLSPPLRNISSFPCLAVSCCHIRNDEDEKEEEEEEEESEDVKVSEICRKFDEAPSPLLLRSSSSSPFPSQGRPTFWRPISSNGGGGGKKGKLINESVGLSSLIRGRRRRRTNLCRQRKLGIGVAFKSFLESRCICKYRRI